VGVILRWLVILLVVAAAIVGAGWGLSDLIQHPGSRLQGAATMIGGTIVPVLVWLVRPVFLGWVGDAARYFSTTPDTPVERQQIRGQGIELLDRLHSQLDTLGNIEYNRIIVVGHSLGSVIAYDLLANYWARVNERILITASSPGLAAIETCCDEYVAPTRN